MRVHLQGHYYPVDDNNMGDTAIEKSVVKQLKKVVPDFERVYKEPELFILGGGGMYTDWQTEAKSTWLPPIEKALSNNVPVVAYGIGLGPWVNDQWHHYYSLFKHFKLLMVRDKKSAERFEKAIVTGDPVICSHQTIKAMLNLVKIHTITEHDKWMEDLCNMLLYVCDIEICNLWKKDPSDFNIELYNKDLYIGMQMHGVMIAALRGIPTVALRYHHKCDQDLENIICKCDVGDGKQWPTLDTPDQIVRKICKFLPKNLKAAAKSRLNMVILKKYLKGEDYGTACLVSNYLNEE